MMRRQSKLVLALGALAISVLGLPVAAQTVYTWTDKGGTVHFADHAPPEAQHVEERNLPAPLPITSGAEVVGDAGAAPADGATPGAPSGPARLVLVTNKAEHSGPTTMHVSGVVKNVGGTAAEGVIVALTSLDPGQGNPCLRSEASLSPSTLAPGETGTFETDLESPCLTEDATVDVTPLIQ